MVERNTSELLDGFISYSRRDTAQADLIEAGLVAAGRSVWIDRQDIEHAEDWLAAILGAIERSASFIALITPDWVQSTYCTLETKHALDQGKKIIPVLLRATPDLAGPTSRFQLISAIDRRLDGEVLHDLLRAMDTDFAFNREHAWLLARAKDWVRNNRTSSLLLRGDRIARGEDHVRKAEGRGAVVTHEQRELIQSSRQRRRRTHALLAAGGVAALAVLVAGREFSLRATSRSLAVTALQEVAINPLRALATAIQSAETRLTVESEEALRTALSQQHELEVVRVAKEEGVQALMLDHDQTLALVNWDGSIQLWNTVSKDMKVILEPAKDRGLVRPSATARRDLFVTGAGPKVYLYRADQQNLQTFEIPSSSVSAVTIDPLGAFICVSLYQGPPAIIDIASGKVVILGTDRALAIAVSADGTTIAVGHAEIELWTPQGEKLRSTKSLVGAVDHIAFNPNGRSLIASGVREAAQLWHLKDDKSITLPHSPSEDDTPLRVTFGTFNTKGTLVATAGKDQKLRIWDAVLGIPLAIMRGHTDSVVGAVFSPDDVLLATASDDGTARIWDPRRGMQVSVLRGHAENLLTIEFSRDGTRVVTGSVDGTARIWQTGSGVIDSSLVQHKSYVNDVRFSATGAMLATASIDGYARLVTLDKSQPPLALPHAPNGGSVREVRFSLDDKLLVSTGACVAVVWALEGLGRDEARIGNDADCVHSSDFLANDTLLTVHAKGIDVWRRKQGWRREKHIISGDFSKSDRISLSADRKLIALSESVSVAVYELASGKKLYSVNTSGSAFGTGFSPDGRYLATASNSRVPMIWSARDGAPVTALSGHSDVVYSAEFSRDGNWLITSSADGTAIVWSVEKWLPTTTLIGHKGSHAYVYRATFHPNSSRIASGATDDRAILYSCEICQSGRQLLNAARARAM